MWKRFRRWLLGTQHEWDLWEIQTVVRHGMAAAFGGTVQNIQRRRCGRCGLYQERGLDAWETDECQAAGEPCDTAPSQVPA